ncbi:MAG: XisH family protein [Deltaproteobacteria bacterium]|nr:XisH family protein [Deltaproteobacteria bacterium]
MDAPRWRRQRALRLRGSEVLYSVVVPALDHLHAAARRALEKDGWTVTHDPLTLRMGGRSLYVDLGAEKLLAATRGNRRIAVEVKTFVGPSLIADLQQAVGQFAMYEEVLGQLEPGRELYLAIPQSILQSVLQDDIGQLMVQRRIPRILGFSPDTEEVIRWIP